MKTLITAIIVAGAVGAAAWSQPAAAADRSPIQLLPSAQLTADGDVAVDVTPVRRGYGYRGYGYYPGYYRPYGSYYRGYGGYGGYNSYYRPYGSYYRSYYNAYRPYYGGYYRYW